MTCLRRLRGSLLLRGLLAAAAVGAGGGGPAWGLIEGGVGNDPIRDPGWPGGAAAAFNHPARVAFWVGPPFGGGQWHGEFRGDAEQLNAALDQFAKVEAKQKRLVVRDGVGRSFWLNPNREAEREQSAAIDWVFIVWQTSSWQRLREMPAQFVPRDVLEGDGEPPVQIEVYTGGNIDWSEVRVPPGLEVVDNRLQAHGFTPADGVVLQGTVTNLETGKPLPATVRLESRDAGADEDRPYATLRETAADDAGRWTLTKIPTGSMRIVVEAAGFAPRVAGYVTADGQPCWQEFRCALASTGHVSGCVVDEKGEPIADAQARLADLVAADGRYDGPVEHRATTDAQGRFQIVGAPQASGRILLDKPGYVARGLGMSVTPPADGLQLRMERSALVRVRVDFADSPRPPEYIVNIEPEGGSKVGSWGGSGVIDGNNEISFDGVPPGRYVLQGRPNPSREGEESEPAAIDLQPGVPLNVTIVARPWRE